MAIIPLRGFGAGGVVSDIPPQDVPPNTVSRALNVLFRDGKILKRSGNRILLNFAGASPRNFAYWLQPWRYAGATRLALFGSESIRVWDGNTVTTAALRDQANNAITLTSATTWQSDQFGAFVVATNATNAPVYSWNPGTSLPDGSVFQVIPGWGASNSPGGAVRAVRSFKNFLFAIGSAADPYTIYWSDAAAVDSFPLSWDYASPNTLAGFAILQASDGLPVDGCVLGDSMIIYTRGATYAATFRPGDTTFPFDFRRLWPWGALGTDTVVQFENRHFVVADEAIYVHDGVTNLRPAAGKVERQIFGEVNDLSKLKVTVNLRGNEVIVYYPTGSATYANRAAVWNWINNTWTFIDLPAATCITPSVLIVPQATYDGQAGRTYDSYAERYDDFGATDGRQVLLCASGPGGPLDLVSFVSVDGGLLRLNLGTVDEASNGYYHAWFERTGIDLDEVAGGISRSRFIRGVFPQIRGTGVISVQIGAAETANSAYLWDTAAPFDLDDPSDYKVDTRLTGRYLGFRIGSWEGDPLPGQWEFTGLDLDVEDGGR